MQVNLPNNIDVQIKFKKFSFLSCDCEAAIAQVVKIT